ncbi:MAG TPA: hypothetical protein VFV50_02675 [Bdellovibrionales bacterium]|nr:hypothetical protein [Bdellovibrionales bacterium]
MKHLVLAFTLLLASAAQAKELSCFTKRFMFGDFTAQLSATIVGDKKLADVVLKMDGKVIRSAAQLNGREYDGRKYKNMVAFSLEGRGVRVVGPYWDEFSMALLMPSGLSKARVGERFEGIITESASDGGTYNQVLCRIQASR